jgi:glycerate-2-kinase
MSRKKELKEIYFQAVKAVLPKTIVKENIVKYKHKKVYIFSIGKAGYDMVKEAEKLLKNNILGGVAISNKKGKLNHIKHFTSTHPLVTQKSVKAAKLLKKEIKKLKITDSFIFFLSGGASAMVELPNDNISLKKFKKISTELLTSGIDIKELNIQRKKLSNIKGGKLADNFKTKNGEVFVLSDVIGDDINTIGSAPMNNGIFKHTIIGNNTKALKKAKKNIQNKVEKTKIITTTLNMNTTEASQYITKKIEKYDKKYESFCLLFGGETTTKVQGDGKGGRNQELALKLLLEKPILKDISILCAGSDGGDGNSKATGAFLDFNIYKKIEKKDLNPDQYLKNCDSNSFFYKVGYDFVTGKTGTNVMDFIIVLKKTQ